MSLTLAETPETAHTLGAVFHIKGHSEIPLTLFQAQNNSLQFLSSQPLPETLLSSDSPAELMQESSCTIPMDVFNHQNAVLLLASDLGIAPLLHLARQASKMPLGTSTMALLYATEGFPFMVKPARYMLSFMPAEAIGGCPLLEDWKIPNRLVSPGGLPGCFDGSLLELFALWLEHENQQRQMQSPILTDWEIVAFLDHENLQACQNLVQSYDWIKFTGLEIPAP